MKIECAIDYSSPTLNIKKLKSSIANKLVFSIGRDPEAADKYDWLNAVILSVRDLMVEGWLQTKRAQESQEVKRVYYISMEFLIGRTLSNALISVGLYNEVKQALDELGLNLEELLEVEINPGLGNGGLGRLAACFLDSLATLNYPGMGYGLRYEYGMFQQCIVDGQQKEKPDNWLKHGFPWEFYQDKVYYTVRFGGQAQHEGDVIKWINTSKVLACAYDQITPGYRTENMNTLRLWSVKAFDEIDLEKFNQGNYVSALEEKSLSENLTSVLYPDDSTYKGKVLRLQQEYVLVSATVQDIVHRHYSHYKTVDNLAEKVSIHLNDTHPTLAIPELMIILMDDYHLNWVAAWEIVTQVFSYTNHTLMSEALETWPIDMMGQVLPYHLQIIFKINFQFLEQVKEMTSNDAFLRRVSIIDEDNGRKIRMAWLAVIASHKVNGVSALHSELMVKSIFKDFAELYPSKFTNITNGVTPRRWIGVANPGLTQLLTKYIGNDWQANLSNLSALNEYIDYPKFLQELREVKQKNKDRLVKYVAETMDIVINPKAMFDMQIKRIHEYKRQTLNLLHVIARYNEILENPEADWVPRVVFFAGKAAPGYYMAKQVIRAINDVANVINNDHRTRGKLKVLFLPNYNVGLAELMIPAADLSEQISLAGYEASGTSNMKFALNGSLIIGTLDGANVEIKEHVGDDNIFIFGNNAQQVVELRENYKPHEILENNPILLKAVTLFFSGYFTPKEPNRYYDITNAMANFGDFYQNIADFDSYYQTQKRVDELYRDQVQWSHHTAMNIANMGYFSSERAIEEYAEKVWDIKPIKL